MKILNVPIEPIEERYTIQWDRWFRKEFAETAKKENSDFRYFTILGEDTSGKISNGSFLDVCETNVYKTQQLERLIRIIKKQDPSELLVIFFQDLWFPGIVNLAYIRDGLGLENVKITGCLHAGAYDPYDFLSKKGMGVWAEHLENAIFKAVDQIYVATHFHKQLVTGARQADPAKVHVTGFPIFNDFVPPLPKEKENLVVFPHRLDSEKNPHLFDRLCRLKTRYPQWNFIKTKNEVSTKAEYFSLLSRAKVAVSFADQETWGIAMQEAALCGAIPVCPNRLSYKEMYPKELLFEDMEDAVQLIEDIMNGLRWHYDVHLPVIQDTIRQKGAAAIPNMIDCMRRLSWNL